MQKSEREKEDNLGWGVRNTTFEKVQKLPRALNIPRQCPLVLLAAVRLKEGKASGSEKRLKG
jgi:hypothetical protein